MLLMIVDAEAIPSCTEITNGYHCVYLVAVTLPVESEKTATLIRH